MQILQFCQKRIHMKKTTFGTTHLLPTNGFNLRENLNFITSAALGVVHFVSYLDSVHRA